MIKDLIEAILPLFKISGGFAEILYLLQLLAVLAFLVLELLFKEGIRGSTLLLSFVSCSPSEGYCGCSVIENTLVWVLGQV
jgi:hypothetical protein